MCNNNNVCNCGCDNPYKILTVKDNHNKYTIKKKELWDLPAKIMLCGKSGVGKSNFLVNLLRNKFYGKDFKGDNIYLFSVSANNDEKLKNLIKLKNIPESNIFDDEDEMMEDLDTVYELVKENYIDAVENKEKPPHILFILDDLAFSGNLKGYDKKSNIINKIMMNGRHSLVSVIITTQKASLCGTGVRTNLNGVVMFSLLPKRELECLETDHNFLKSKKDFYNMYYNNTVGRYDFMIINYTNKNGIYQDKYFKTIKNNNIDNNING